MLVAMSKLAAATALLLACSSSDDPLERLPSPPPMAPQWPLPPPPPPPPPPLQSSQPPPTQIATFLRAHAADPSPWRATVSELANDKRGRQTTLGDADAAELAARLGSNDSYVDGDIGCFTNRSIVYRLTRGTASLEVMVNCGHVSLDGVEWHAATLSSEMIEFLDRLAARP